MAYRIEARGDLPSEIARVAREELDKLGRDWRASERGDGSRRAAVERRVARLRALLVLVPSHEREPLGEARLAELERADELQGVRVALERECAAWRPNGASITSLLEGFESSYTEASATLAYLTLGDATERFERCRLLVQRHADLLRLLRAWCAERPPRDLARVEALARLLGEAVALGDAPSRPPEGEQAGESLHPAVRRMQVRQQALAMGRALFGRARHPLGARLTEAAGVPDAAQLDPA